MITPQALMAYRRLKRAEKSLNTAARKKAWSFLSSDVEAVRLDIAVQKAACEKLQCEREYNDAIMKEAVRGLKK